MRRTIPRTAAVVLAAGLTAVGLSACQSTSYTCSNGDCSISLSGSGASTDLGNRNLEVTLHGAGDGTAEFSVDGEQAQCSAGESLLVGGHDVTCTDVGDDSLDLELS